MENTMNQAETLNLLEMIRLGLRLHNTIENGQDDRFTQKAYAAIRAEIVREIEEVCYGTWGYMDAYCKGRENLIGVRADLAGGADNTWNATKANPLAAANRLIAVEYAKIERGEVANVSKWLDDANRWIVAASNAHGRLTAAVAWADRVWDLETD